MRGGARAPGRRPRAPRPSWPPPPRPGSSAWWPPSPPRRPRPRDALGQALGLLAGDPGRGLPALDRRRGSRRLVPGVAARGARRRAPAARRGASPTATSGTAASGSPRWRTPRRACAPHVATLLESPDDAEIRARLRRGGPRLHPALGRRRGPAGAHPLAAAGARPAGARPGPRDGPARRRALLRPAARGAGGAARTSCARSSGCCAAPTCRARGPSRISSRGWARAAMASGDPRLAATLIDEMLGLEFAYPEFSGFTSEWGVRVNPAHLRNIRAYLAIIGDQPGASRGALVASLVVHLRVGGVFVADTDVFQRDVSALLGCEIEPVYLEVKQLLRVFPVYFREIGAEGRLRETSTRLDQIDQRRDPLCHFLRKQSHVECNPRLIAFAEEILRFWATRRRRARCGPTCPGADLALLDADGGRLRGAPRRPRPRSPPAPGGIDALLRLGPDDGRGAPRGPAAGRSARPREDRPHLRGARGAAAQVRAGPLRRHRAPARVPPGGRPGGARPRGRARAGRRRRRAGPDPAPARGAAGDRAAARARRPPSRTSTSSATSPPASRACTAPTARSASRPWASRSGSSRSGRPSSSA